jgi:hypothetical protein
MNNQPKLKDILSEAFNKPNTIMLDNMRLYEVDLHRIISTYSKNGFIIISAWRSARTEFGDEATPEQIQELMARNKQNDKELKQQIRTSGYGYVPTWGGYKEKLKNPETREFLVDPKTGENLYADTKTPEPSYIVMARESATTVCRPKNPDRLKELGQKWCAQFNQDSFLWAPPISEDTNIYFITKDGNIDNTFEGPMSINDLTQEYYSQLRKGQKRRFTVTESGNKSIDNFIFYMRDQPHGMDEAIRRYGEIFFNLE